MKKATAQELKTFFESLSAEFDLRVPVRLHDGTRVLGSLSEGPLALEGGKIPQKPTSVFFPQFDEVFVAESSGELAMAQPPAKPIMLVGMTAEDLDCLEFIDKFFAENFRDDIYFNKRDGAVVVGISGRCGKDGEFMKIAGGKCDIELISDGECCFIVHPYTEKGKELIGRLKSCECGCGGVKMEQLKEESDGLPTDDEKTIDKASELIRAGRVPDEFWSEIATRCIACTGCNLACPTCTCFEVYDRERDGKMVRQRGWDSCQLDGFQREASGHNPAGKQLQRTYRRIHHKLAADVERWGHRTCMLCGRCDEVCPTDIGMKSVCGEIVKRYS
ncbi:MAG: 4Fe-4S dicluster domain-containing protein [Candidatus Coatesbacteria bacterium]|nr:4Fe-4S dicluster domain-containing protein [Candidatus Coatesbacteria bacterium]